MNLDFIKPLPWSIVEEGFDPDRVEAAESLFSIGNGAMGQRANFEEAYSGPTFQGSYIAGVYYPDKTKVGWWKNGYPEYFAKVLNAPNWIGIDVRVNDEAIDLNTCKEVTKFRRELNMQEGWYRRDFELILNNGLEVAVTATRFLSLVLDNVGLIHYEITVLNGDATVTFSPYVDGGITNKDSNWDDTFWEITKVQQQEQQGFVEAHTNKTFFHTCTFMENRLYYENQPVDQEPEPLVSDRKVALTYSYPAEKGKKVALIKFGGYTVSRNHPKDRLVEAAKTVLSKALKHGFEEMLKQQAQAWAKIWHMSDITIEGDVRAQQAIRFNIFHLNQTYLGTDSRLNIGPKGFTGEKYGGSTYWDTEAYCLPFYMATKSHEVARNLLQYRYNHLEKAIENAEKLGFSDGAALYPMVTMNGEECHNEWEITFEEIHRNGAIAFAIFNYERYTGDFTYIPEMGLEVLIAIARFWHQRANYSEAKKRYVILGVTGPNEYENNINNNWYTNYMAKWCINYAIAQWNKVREGYPEDFERISGITGLDEAEVESWAEVANKLYFPYSEEHGIYLQQDGFLDKELNPVSALKKSDRPINQKWSWDRILRSPYIKQADVLQGFYFFESHFTPEELERHFDFYEPLTVHESSLSPCIHAVLAASLGRMEKAYELYLRTARLDLDDYNHEVHEGLHITSMAGTWLSIVEGFGGMRMVDDKLSFRPQIPDGWNSYSFKLNFRNRILKVSVDKAGASFELDHHEEMSIRVNGKRVVVRPRTSEKV